MYRYLYIYIKINFSILLYSRIIDRFNRPARQACMPKEPNATIAPTGSIDRHSCTIIETSLVRFLRVTVSRSPFPFENRRERCLSLLSTWQRINRSTYICIYINIWLFRCVKRISFGFSVVLSTSEERRRPSESDLCASRRSSPFTSTATHFLHPFLLFLYV